MKRASGGRIGRFWRFSQQPDAGRSFPTQRRDRREQRQGVGVERSLHDLSGRAEFDHLAQIHHRDPIAHMTHDSEIMRNEDVRQVVPIL